MYSIQELTVHCEAQLKEIKSAMDRNGGYHPEVASLYRGLKRSVAKEVQDSLRRMSLAEILIKSGSGGGLAGAGYLVPVKLHDELVYAVRNYNIAELVASNIITNWVGGALDIPIIRNNSFIGQHSSSGGAMPSETFSTVKATLTPQLITANVAMDNSLIEDNELGLINWCVKQAAQVMGYKENAIILDTLINAPDGDGTLSSSETGDADQTLFNGGATSDVSLAMSTIAANRFKPNTLITTLEAWTDNIDNVVVSGRFAAPGVDGFDLKYGYLDILFSSSPLMHASTDAFGAPFTDCKNLIFDRKNAVIVGRKRWLQIENYADPVHDLSGAVITSRVDAVTAYKNSIYYLYET